MKDLTVEIPKKYKKALIERFSLKNAKEMRRMCLFRIEKKCPLCSDYLVHVCKGCPFRKFSLEIGCIVWVKNLIEYPFFIMGHTDHIEWYVQDDKKARKQLKLLKKKARKLIKWV